VTVTEPAQTIPTDPVSVAAAKDLTARIRASAEHTWALLSEAHNRLVHFTLGYADWKSYVKTEFGMSEQHSFRMLDHASVVKDIEKVTGSPVGESVTERAARDIKPRIKQIAETIRERIVDVDEDKLLEIVEQVVIEARKELADERAAARGDKPSDALKRMLGAIDIINLLPPAETVADGVAYDPVRYDDLRSAVRWINTFCSQWGSQL
jgi:hypothetical protein